ncbi:hypothetical protein MKJ04_09095 [Pontibacter sp. E15-1]|uniref:hypothetical protein n=1 Tax=Pontibacter sp. E15-1 TaxID=2919918 RepID=UPI001F4F76C6|nr:hypothetical protein [Pontibacter sp. E15-1]MCJ8165000.1 hypothetical protein [Pontibacter sp. E15-1]
MARRLQYGGLNPEAFDQLKGKLQGLGLNLQQNNGSFKEKGVSGKYDYNPESEVLILDDVQVGFPASMMLNLDSLEQRMTEAVVQFGGRPQQA